MPLSTYGLVISIPLHRDERSAPRLETCSSLLDWWRLCSVWLRMDARRHPGAVLQEQWRWDRILPETKYT